MQEYNNNIIKSFPPYLSFSHTHTFYKYRKCLIGKEIVSSMPRLFLGTYFLICKMNTIASSL